MYCHDGINETLSMIGGKPEILLQNTWKYLMKEKMFIYLLTQQSHSHLQNMRNLSHVYQETGETMLFANTTTIYNSTKELPNLLFIITVLTPNIHQSDIG